MTDVKVKIPNEIKQIFLFCVVGVVGFVVDTAVLYLLKSILAVSYTHLTLPTTSRV